jgi:thioredoxin 1
MLIENNLLVITDENYEKEVVREPGLVLVEIYADWSGSCHMMTAILERLAEEFRGMIKIGKRNIETSQQVARDYGVTQLPILLFFKNGQVVDHIIGTVPKKVIEKHLTNLIAKVYDVPDEVPQPT